MLQGLWSWVNQPHDTTRGLTAHASMALMVVVGSIPTALIGLIFKDPLEKLFGSVTTVGVMLLVTGMITGVTKFIPEEHGKWDRVKVWMAFAIGVPRDWPSSPAFPVQLHNRLCTSFGTQKGDCGPFFLSAFHSGHHRAVGLQLESDAIARVGMMPLVAGFVSAALVGFFALKLLMGMVKKGHFYYFAPYCLAIGTLTIMLS